MFISIIIPVYNVERYIKQCVDSVLDQTYRDIEVILVDDGSPDDCPRICDEYAKKDERVKVIHKANGGLSSARKAGIESSHGEYIMLIDADDWIDKETIAICVDSATKECADCVMCSYMREYPHGAYETALYDKEFVARGEEVDKKVHRRLYGLVGKELAFPEKADSIGSCCMKLYSREVALKGRYFDIKEIGSAEDILFNIYALSGCNCICYINKPMYHYRKQRNSSITSTYRPELKKQWGTKLFKYFEDSIREYNLPAEYSDALSNRIALSIIGIGLNAILNPDRKERIREIRTYISSEEYTEAIKNLQLQWLPWKWKVLMYCSKRKFAILIYHMLLVISWLRRRM